MSESERDEAEESEFGRKVAKIRLSSEGSVTAYIPGRCVSFIYTAGGKRGRWVLLSRFWGRVGRKVGKRGWVCLDWMKTYAEILCYHQ